MNLNASTSSKMKLFDIESRRFIVAIFYSIEVGDEGPSMYDGLCGL